MMTATAPSEERIVLRHVRWDTYERPVADHEDARSPMALYAQFGVAEVWRHDGSAATIHVLVDDAYQRTDRSLAVPVLDAATLTELLDDGLRRPLPGWLRRVRQWAESSR